MRVAMGEHRVAPTASFSEAWVLGAGRMGRLAFFGSRIMLGLILLIGASTQNTFVFLITAFVVSWVAITCNARRLHDLGWSGWLQLLLAVPLAGFVLGLFMTFKAGDRGPNKYGRA